MVTIAGTGMGDYNFDNINLDFSKYDKISNKLNTYPSRILHDEHELTKQMQNLMIMSGQKIPRNKYILDLNENHKFIILLKKEKIAFKIIDNTSSLNYMLAKEGVSLVKTGIVTLHGKTNLDLENFLVKDYTFIICDENTPRLIKEATEFLNEEDFSITLGEQFAYKDEKFSSPSLDFMLKNPPKMPFSLLLKKNYKTLPNISSEDTIEHENGMITKTYKRHISLQNLDLQANMLMWDVGAGSGSVSIDAYKRYKVKSIMFEKNEKRAKMIQNSLNKHKILSTKLYIGEASQDYKKEQSTPERIFIGGGGDKVISELDYLYTRLADGGLMLANFVTLQHLTTAITVLKKADIKFDIKSISLTTYKMSLLMPEPERVMHQIIVKKESLTE